MSGVQPEGVDEAWRHVFPRIADAYGRTGLGLEYDEDELKGELKSGDKQVWVVHSENEMFAVVLTEIVTKYQMKILKIHTVGGTDLDEWMDMAMDTLNDFAKENDCDIIRAGGRGGWNRVLKKYGPKNIRYEFDLEIRHA